VIVWSVVVPQAVAYAQIAGLPPSPVLPLRQAPFSLYALLRTSRSLVVSATTATSALSAAAVGPLAAGDAARFAACRRRLRSWLRRS
jgi:SulP family sulfate permease